jgi:hypothetical protein
MAGKCNKRQNDEISIGTADEEGTRASLVGTAAMQRAERWIEA